VALDLDDLGADLERRRDVVPGHLDQTVPQRDGIVHFDEVEPAQFIDAKQDRPARAVARDASRTLTPTWSAGTRVSRRWTTWY